MTKRELSTRRTILRRFSMDDVENMHQLESDPEVVRYIPLRKPIPKKESRLRLEKQIDRQQNYGDLGIWAADLKSGEFVGWFMLLPADPARGADFPELGFMVLRKFWGQGYTSEISKELIRYLFKDLEFPAVSAMTDDDHHASIAVLEKLGFKFIKNLKKFDPALSREITLKIFQLNKN